MDNHKKADMIFRFSIGIAFLLIPLVFFFLWKSHFSFSSPIDHEKFGTFGDVVGGIFGSMWALAGVLLFYIALKDQKEDIRLNRDALEKQVEALEVQTKEFQLQHVEMHETRKVFKEQSAILKKQSFESTYFSLLDLYHNVVGDLNSHSSSGNYFLELTSEIKKKSRTNATNPYATHCAIKDTFIDIYNDKKHELAHYFKLLYRVLNIIDESTLDDRDKLFYVKILRSQLSENELLALYYNSHTDVSSNFYTISLRYNLFKHLPCISKVEFEEFVSTGVITKMVTFTSVLFGNISNFLDDLDVLTKQESFNGHKISFEVPVLHDGCIIAISTAEQSKLEIRLSTSRNRLDHLNYLGLEKSKFESFLVLILCNMFIFSTYSENNFAPDGISINKTKSSDKELVVNVISSRKLFLNTDYQ